MEAVYPSTVDQSSSRESTIVRAFIHLPDTSVADYDVTKFLRYLNGCCVGLVTSTKSAWCWPRLPASVRWSLRPSAQWTRRRHRRGLAACVEQSKTIEQAKGVVAARSTTPTDYCASSPAVTNWAWRRLPRASSETTSTSLR